MRNVIPVLLVLSLFSAAGGAQPPGRAPLYDTAVNPANELAANLSAAFDARKHILLSVGGNWCKWCYRFHDFIEAHPELDSILRADYIVQHVNYSKENRNLPFLSTIGFPQRFGFPVFVIMNSQGELLHTQSSWFLEDGEESYDADKVKDFLVNWSPAALDPRKYMEGK